MEAFPYDRWFSNILVLLIVYGILEFLQMSEISGYTLTVSELKFKGVILYLEVFLEPRNIEVFQEVLIYQKSV